MANRKKELVDITQLGKIPPQQLAAEKSVLGILLLHGELFDSAFETLRSFEMFYLSQHQLVFQAMENLRNAGSTIDQITVMAELAKMNELETIGGPYYLTTLSEGVKSAAGIESQARLIAESYMSRQLIQVCGNVVNMAYSNHDAFELVDFAERGIMGVNTYQKSTYNRIDSSVVPAIKKIDSLRFTDKELTGITTGFKQINELTCGWQEPDLIILAARPSVGKTAFALNLLRNAAAAPVDPVGVGMFSMEMSEQQLINRLLSIESGIRLEKITRGRLDEEEMKKLLFHGDQLSRYPIFIDDTAALNIYELRNKARRMVNKDHVGLIIIDYLQLMSGVNTGRNENREQEISKISRDLKSLAKELKTPIIALSQLSREVEKRPGNLPKMSDLRESGAIEQDADIVMFMYRPEYHGKNHDEETGASTNGETHIKFGKHRSGALDTIKLRAELAIQRFHDWEQQLEIFGAPPAAGNWKPYKEEPADEWDKKF